MQILKIELEDKGQDFFFFYIHRKRIVATEPFQGWVWNGQELTQDSFSPGDSLTFSDGKTLRYRVVSVSTISREQLDKLPVKVLPIDDEVA